MEKLIALLKLIGFLCLLLTTLPAFANWPVIDSTQVGKTIEVINEAKKGNKTASDTLETSKDVLNQTEKVNKALGNGATVGVDAFGWLNNATGAANSAMQACGIDGFIPPLKGIKIPGIDMPDFDLSCMKSAFKAVEEGLYTIRKFQKKDPSIIIKPGSGEEAALLHRPSYYAKDQEELLKRQQEYREKTIKSVQAAANRNSSMGTDIIKIENQLAVLGNKPADINSLLRIMIATQLAQMKQDNEHYATFAKFADMMSAQYMNQIKPTEISETE